MVPVERLAGKRVKVIAGCLKEETVAELRETPGHDDVIALQMDVSNDASIARAYDALLQRHPQIRQCGASRPRLA